MTSNSVSSKLFSNIELNFFLDLNFENSRFILHDIFRLFLSQLLLQKYCLPLENNNFIIHIRISVFILPLLGSNDASTNHLIVSYAFFIMLLKLLCFFLLFNNLSIFNALQNCQNWKFFLFSDCTCATRVCLSTT